MKKDRLKKQYKLTSQTYRIARTESDGSIRLLILKPNPAPAEQKPAVLWIHGGGYATGMAEMVYMTRARDLVEYLGCTVVCPAYRLSLLHPFPAGFDDCWTSLMWLKEHAAALETDPARLMIGGESAGGGMCAALAIKARDTQAVSISFQMPLYPMLYCRDTPSSADNHQPVWNTRYNHAAWRMYLRALAKSGSKNTFEYASPYLVSSVQGLPAAFSFVSQEEPFFNETEAWFRRLRQEGIPARLLVLKKGFHAWDLMHPFHPRTDWIRRQFLQAAREGMKLQAPQPDKSFLQE